MVVEAATEEEWWDPRAMEDRKAEEDPRVVARAEAGRKDEVAARAQREVHQKDVVGRRVQRARDLVAMTDTCLAQEDLLAVAVWVTGLASFKHIAFHAMHRERSICLSCSRTS